MHICDLKNFNLQSAFVRHLNTPIKVPCIIFKSANILFDLDVTYKDKLQPCLII